MLFNTKQSLEAIPVVILSHGLFLFCCNVHLSFVSVLCIQDQKLIKDEQQFYRFFKTKKVFLVIKSFLDSQFRDNFLPKNF